MYSLMYENVRNAVTMIAMVQFLVIKYSCYLNSLFLRFIPLVSQHLQNCPIICLSELGFSPWPRLPKGGKIVAEEILDPR